MDETGPLGLFLVNSGSKGDRLLFRYPYQVDDQKTSSSKRKQNNPYALIVNEDYLTSTRGITGSELGEKNVLNALRFPDKALSNLFAVKLELCDRKFELKVNDVRFVGHPTPLSQTFNREPSSILMFNIVFALRANASHAVVNCYHKFSQRIAIALQHEERRCGYVTSQAKMMVLTHDEVATLPEDSDQSPYALILTRCQLAQALKKVFEDLRSTGEVHLRIHNWIEVSFCLPNKVHRTHNKDIFIEPQAIQSCLAALKPYHGMLMLVDVQELLMTLPHDASPALVRLVQITSPLKSLQQLSADTDLTLTQVFQLVGHLVYWAKATIIYPLCESNVYILSPNAPTCVNSPLVEKFREKFMGMSLLSQMSEFSLPTSLSQVANPLDSPQEKFQQVQMIVWMLQHRLLMQLHMYVYLIPTSQPPLLLNIHQQDNRRPSTDEALSGVQGFNQSDYGSSFHSEESLGGSPIHSALSGSSSKSGSEEDLSSRDPSNAELLAELSPSEREAIMKVPAASNTDDLKLFVRLRPYFTGKHHLEEIMYYENVRRSQLVAVLDKFRDVLITMKHEDATVASFYRHSR
ncbi:GATOR complex protein Nprl3 [Tachypleus tridentatus]|uniref:GATOR complex protein Nprl3 n=1 Tax=Tachypleus tridentatus TaxID=6853 RepID=UPI003FD6149A